MVRHNAASLCLFGLAAADMLLIGAAGMWPKIPPLPQPQIVVVPLELPFANTVAFGMGLPSASVTFPVIVRFWAESCPHSKTTQLSIKRSLMYSSVWFSKLCCNLKLKHQKIKKN